MLPTSPFHISPCWRLQGTVPIHVAQTWANIVTIRKLVQSNHVQPVLKSKHVDRKRLKMAGEDTKCYPVTVYIYFKCSNPFSQTESILYWLTCGRSVALWLLFNKAGKEGIPRLSSTEVQLSL